MNRIYKKSIYEDLKIHFSKSLYKCRKNILKAFADNYYDKHLILSEVDEKIPSEKNKKIFFYYMQNIPI